MRIKDTIKSYWLGRFLVSELHCVESKIRPALCNDEKAIKKYYFRCMGKPLNLENPQSLTEKMNWYKLKERDPLLVQCADKYAVRKYIKDMGYKQCLNELYGVYNSVDEIDIDALPQQFVLKAAHGSHMNLIVRDKNAINWKKEKIMMRSWLCQDIYWSGREWAYKDVPKRIIAERYLEDETGELKDYKFFCFNGKPWYMLYIGNRYNGKEFLNFYDMDGNDAGFYDINLPSNPDVPFPLSKADFQRMKIIAEDLAKPFKHVRVDLYMVGKEIFFGELTFYHGGGCMKFNPPETDERIGAQWDLFQ